MNRVETLGLIVAGGAGRRLGAGVPKAAARLGGCTLLERAVATLRPICDAVVVAAPAGLMLPEAGVPRVDDAPGGAGPLAGLVAGLAARAHRIAIVLGVDFPLMRTAALAALRDARGAHPAVVPEPGGVPQPLAAVYANAAAARLEGARMFAVLMADRISDFSLLGDLAKAAARLEAAWWAGERSVTAAALALGPSRPGDAELEVLEGGLANFFNLNTPADLAEAGRRLATRAAAGEEA